MDGKIDIPRTFGALLVGGIVAAIFSGVVTVQVFAYFKYFPLDANTLRALVITVWLLDILHTIFVSMSLWDHLIEHFGDVSRIDVIPWSLALTIAITAILTFLVHCFFVHRIYKLSRNNLFIAIPLGIIASLRLCFACLTTVKMIGLRSLSMFVEKYTWSFTSGLGLSSLLDVLITAFLCFFLMAGRKKNTNASIHHILDSLILYAFESGLITCAATVVSMICWLTMPTNLIFMGLHFVISKFYANSLLATLNTRKILNSGYHSRTMSPLTDGDRRRSHYSDMKDPSRLDSNMVTKVQIKVDESTVRTGDSAKYLVPTYLPDTSSSVV